MKQLKKQLFEFFKDARYLLPIIIVAILSFGFAINNYSVNVDSLEYERYYRSGNELLGQKRFGIVFISHIIRVFEFNPFFNDCLSVILLILTATIFCALFKQVTNNKLNKNVYTIFSCLFISYPIISEIFLYVSLNIGIGYLLVALCLYGIYNCKKNILDISILSIIMCITVAIYESFATVYLCGVFIILILEILYNSKERKLKPIIIEFLKMIIPLVIGVILSSLISKIIIKVMNIPQNIYAAKQITYQTLGLIEGIKNLLKTIFFDYIIAGLFYLPITILIISIIIFILVSCILSIKNRNLNLTIVALGAIVSIFSLSIIQGEAAPYRTAQALSLFVAFVFMLLLQLIFESKAKNIVKNIVFTFVILLIFYQSAFLHKMFYLNYLKYQAEKITITNIANHLQSEHDITKPVIFVGNYEIPNYIKKQVYMKSNDSKAQFIYKLREKWDIGSEKYSIEEEYIGKPMQTIINSYINWGMIAFEEPNTSLFNWLKLLGYDDLKQGNKEMVNEARKMSGDLPHYPEQGYIVELEDYIIVNI